MALLKWYLNPSSSRKKQTNKKKNVVKVGPPLTKLSDSTHVNLVESLMKYIFVNNRILFNFGQQFSGNAI